MIEEFHVNVLAPTDLPKRAYRAMVHALIDRRLHTGIRLVIRQQFGRYPALREARIRLTR
jgi:hypothetical protein